MYIISRQWDISDYLYKSYRNVFPIDHPLLTIIVCIFILSRIKPHVKHYSNLNLRILLDLLHSRNGGLFFVSSSTETRTNQISHFFRKNIHLLPQRDFSLFARTTGSTQSRKKLTHESGSRPSCWSARTSSWFWSSCFKRFHGSWGTFSIAYPSAVVQQRII